MKGIEPLESHSIGLEKLRTVFVFALAHLEGPPPELVSVLMGILMGKWQKIVFGDKICPERVTML